MKPNGFVAAVTAAVASGRDELWQSHYYHGTYRGVPWDSRRLETYLDSCAVRLGPEWQELQRCAVQVQLAATRPGYRIRRAAREAVRS